MARHTCRSGSIGSLADVVPARAAASPRAAARIAAPAAALLAGALTEKGLLTVGMDQMNDDASQYQFAISGLFLIIAAIKLPSGGIGTSARAIKRAQKAKTP